MRLNVYGGRQGNLDRVPRHGNPLDERLAANLVVSCRATRDGCAGGEGDWDGDVAGVAVGFNRDGGDALAAGRELVVHVGLALVQLHAVLEVLGDVIVLEGDDGPLCAVKA